LKSGFENEKINETGRALKMLFNRQVARRDAIINGIASAVFAIAASVLYVICAVQAQSVVGLLPQLIMLLLVVVSGVIVAVAWIKNDKKTAYATSLIAMPLYAAPFFILNIDLLVSGSIMDHFWPLGLGYMWYLIAVLTVLESFAYELIHVVKGKSNPKFSPAMNTETAAFLLAGAAVCFVIWAGKNYTSILYWALFIGLLGEIALVEAFAESLDLASRSETENK
jgi:hypothetical protein